MTIRTDVPALSHDDAEEEHKEQGACSDPSVCGVGGGFVEVGLVYLVRNFLSRCISCDIFQ